MVKTNVIPQLLSSNAPAAVSDLPRGIKPPVPISNPWLWLALAMGLLLLAFVAWWIWKRRRTKTATSAPEVLIPPYEKAWANLREALNLMDQPRPFCILVSDTIRFYLEERFQLRAPERTTEEFLEELQSSALLGFDQKGALGEFLMACDMVKFARYEPGRQELQGIYEAAARLIEETQAPMPGATTVQAVTPNAP